MQIKFYGAFFMVLILTFVSGWLLGEPAVHDYPVLLPEKSIQIKVGVIVGNNVFSYDDFQKVDVVYPKPDEDEQKTPGWGWPLVNPVMQSILQWFAGDLATKTIRLAPLPSRIGILKTKQIEYTELCLQWDDERIKRWCYKDGSFWCIPERIVQFEDGLSYAGAHNEQLPSLFQTRHTETMPVNVIEKEWGSFIEKNNNRPDDIERAERIRIVSTLKYAWGRSQVNDEKFQCCSMFPPLQRTAPCYDYLSGGFDFMPITCNHWQLCTLMPCHENSKSYFPFTVWEAHSRIVERDGVSGYENKWTVLTQSLLSWGGKFFAVPIRNTKNELPSFHLIRDSNFCERLTAEDIANDFLKSYAVSGELYRLDIAEEDKIDEKNKPLHRHYMPMSRWATQTVHCKKPVLDPKEHKIIALIYLEPEGFVYGFGKDFYVRLDVLPETGDLTSAIVPCRDITAGEVCGLDHTGKERVIGEPFRTVWQCAGVLFNPKQQ